MLSIAAALNRAETGWLRQTPVTLPAWVNPPLFRSSSMPDDTASKSAPSASTPADGIARLSL